MINNTELNASGIKNFSPTEIGCRIRNIRRERNLTMRDLAYASSVSASLISKIEAGRVSPTITSLQKLLHAMHVDLDEFFSNGSGHDLSEQIAFRRSEMSTSQDAERKQYFAFPRHPEIKAEMTYEEHLPLTKISEKEASRSDAFGMVLSGEMTLEVVGKETVKVKSGDAFYIKAGWHHIVSNQSDEILRLLCVRIR